MGNTLEQNKSKPRKILFFEEETTLVSSITHLTFFPKQGIKCNCYLNIKLIEIISFSKKIH